ncbi:MAG TPA: (2Fe-2S)-binding protein [Rubricoccaceae bacterium]|nr:(2Fe-2S)-binding protein [Rubricoccaceae bacterium]
MSGLRIDRCLCFGVSFAELKRTADATGADTVEVLQQHRLFGQRCRLCHPYVRRMLRTGATVFDEIVTDADEPAEG